MNRRWFLGTSAVGLTAVAFALPLRPASAPAGQKTANPAFEVVKTDEEWRRILSAQQYAVLRQEGTEYSFSSPLLHEKRKGHFACAGCELPLYSSKHKYDSGTGWPSFWQALPDAVGTKTDSKFFMTRTEVHCRRCGGHLGHVFDDGPEPTGKRHCINGVALKFVEA
ncbi:MAG: peptide-methionine (R)-S-oxide reductase MsrB [Pseudomonadota bacterium]